MTMDKLLKKIDVEFSKLARSNDIQPVFALFRDETPLAVVSACEAFREGIDRVEALKDVTAFVRNEAKRVGADRCVFVSEQWATRVEIPAGSAVAISVKEHVEKNGMPSQSPAREEVLVYAAEERIPDQIIANRMLGIRKITSRGKKRQLGPLTVETKGLIGGPLDGMSRRTGFGVFSV